MTKRQSQTGVFQSKKTQGQPSGDYFDKISHLISTKRQDSDKVIKVKENIIS